MRNRLRPVIVLTVIALLVAACAGADGEAADTTAGDGAVETTVADTDTTTAEGSDTTSAPSDSTEEEGNAGPIKFGMLIGVTGDYSPYYDVSKAGADVAIAEINEEGGVLGRPVELVVVDNKSTVEGAVQGFSQIVDVEGIHALGGPESDGAIANLQAIKDLQMPTICPACGTSELDQAGGDYIFRITGSDSDGGLINAQFARDAGYTRVAMLVQNTEGASAPADVFKQVFTDIIGGEVVADVRFDPGLSSYQAQVDQAFADDPEAVYVGAGFEAGGIILQEWQRRGYGGTFLFSPDMVVPEISALAEQGIEIGDGVARAAIAAYDTESPAYETYAPRFEELAGEPPTPGLYDANQYDQYMILAIAMTQAGTTDKEAVAAAIPDILNPPGTEVFSYAEAVAAIEAGEEIDYHGASSSLDVNEFGNLASPNFGEQHIIDGQWTQVATVELDPSLRP
jgi:branched-chain amino acid transport system substrate-binding protein